MQMVWAWTKKGLVVDRNYVSNDSWYFTEIILHQEKEWKFFKMKQQANWLTSLVSQAEMPHLPNAKKKQNKISVMEGVFNKKS